MFHSILRDQAAVAYQHMAKQQQGAAIVKKVSETAKNLEFKAGVVEGIVYDAEGIKAIADIPSREVLISKLLGSFKSPISSFARVIQADCRQGQRSSS